MGGGMTRLRAGEWEVRSHPTKEARRLVFPEARALVAALHYSGGTSNIATDLHTLHERGGDGVLGVAWWLPTTKNAAISVAGDDWRRCVALSRLAIDPSVPPNACSFLLGRAVRSLRAEGRWTTLVTWADEGEGHTGAIYRATNWEYLGRTKPALRYRGPDGRLMSRKRGPKTLSHAEMLAWGYTAEGPFAKHKFRLRL